MSYELRYCGRSRYFHFPFFIIKKLKNKYASKRWSNNTHMKTLTRAATKMSFPLRLIARMEANNAWVTVLLTSSIRLSGARTFRLQVIAAMGKSVSLPMKITNWTPNSAEICIRQKSVKIFGRKNSASMEYDANSCIRNVKSDPASRIRQSILGKRSIPIWTLQLNQGFWRFYESSGCNPLYDIDYFFYIQIISFKWK